MKNSTTPRSILILFLFVTSAFSAIVFFVTGFLSYQISGGSSTEASWYSWTFGIAMFVSLIVLIVSFRLAIHLRRRINQQ